MITLESSKALKPIAFSFSAFIYDAHDFEISAFDTQIDSIVAITMIEGRVLCCSGGGKYATWGVIDSYIQISDN